MASPVPQFESRTLAGWEQLTPVLLTRLPRSMAVGAWQSFAL